MPKTEPLTLATRGDLFTAVAVIFVLILLIEFVETYAPRGTTATLRRIEQKVNQCQP